MRLIDADEFKKQIAGMAIVNNYPADKANNLCELIDCQPTSYDAEKVIKEIKELPTHTFETYSQGYPMEEDFVDPCEVIKIVKSGGVENGL